MEIINAVLHAHEPQYLEGLAKETLFSPSTFTFHWSVQMLLETIKSFLSRFNFLCRPQVSVGDKPEEQPCPAPALPAVGPSKPIYSQLGEASTSSSGGTVATFPDAYISATRGAGSGEVGHSFLDNAHDFVISNSNFISQIIHSGGTVLQHLIERGMYGAEVDSYARMYSPRCHSDTRKSLRGRIVEWIERKRDRDWRMLWILGPAGVGKSAIAQTIAEEMKTAGRLGAAIFFSRPHQRDDPNQVIPTLAFQLAVTDSEYKRIITQRLADDPTILDKNWRTQFRELITDPFHVIMTRRPSATRKPLLIILDGLDECKGEEAQCEFMELISEHARNVPEFPLLWMICSRWEWHFKCLVSQPDFPTACKREEISIDDEEAQRDVIHVLRTGFAEIRRRFFDYLDFSWPPDEIVRRIAVLASGLFAFAATILRFVGDVDADDPCGQLKLCMKFLGGPGMPGAINPLHALDLLYHRIFSNVPSNIRSTTTRILGALIFYSNEKASIPLSAQGLANLLHLDRSTFYRSLRRLYSVLEVPSGVDAQQSSIKFHHASFQDYLRDPNRSREFAVNEEAVHHDVAMHALRWKLYFQTDVTRGLTWSQGELVQLLSSLRDFSSSVVWDACCKVTEKDAPAVLSILKELDFREIQIDTRLLKLLLWLRSLGGETRSLVHARTAECPLAHSAKTINLDVDADDFERCWFAFGIATQLVQSGRSIQVHIGLGGRELEVKVTPFESSDPVPDAWFLPSLRTSSSAIGYEVGAATGVFLPQIYSSSAGWTFPAQSPPTPTGLVASERARNTPRLSTDLQDIIPDDFATQAEIIPFRRILPLQSVSLQAPPQPGPGGLIFHGRKKSVSALAQAHSLLHPYSIVLTKHHCEICGDTFTHKQYLDLHVRSRHIQLRRYTCGFHGCSARFFHLHSRDHHVRLEHYNRYYSAV